MTKNIKNQENSKKYNRFISPVLLVTKNIFDWLDGKSLTELKYLLIMYKWNGHYKQSYASHQKIAWYVGVCRRTIIRYQNMFESEGVLGVIRRGYKKTNLYYFGSYFMKPDIAKILQLHIGNINFSKEYVSRWLYGIKLPNSGIVTQYQNIDYAEIFYQSKNDKKFYLDGMPPWFDDPPANEDPCLGF